MKSPEGVSPSRENEDDVHQLDRECSGARRRRSTKLRKMIVKWGLFVSKGEPS
jgi:hypothetical protein